MIAMLKDWKGKVNINDVEYDNIQAFISSNKQLSDNIHIKLYSLTQKRRLQSKIQSDRHNLMKIKK